MTLLAIHNGPSDLMLKKITSFLHNWTLKWIPKVEIDCASWTSMRLASRILHNKKITNKKNNKSKIFGITNWPKCLAAIFGRPKYFSKQKYFLEPTTNKQAAIKMFLSIVPQFSFISILILKNSVRKWVGNYFQTIKKFLSFKRKNFGRMFAVHLAPEISSEEKFLRRK